MIWSIKESYLQYTKNRPTGPIINIVYDEHENPIQVVGPHEENDIIYLVGSTVFGIIERNPYIDNFVQVHWEDSIISAPFSKNATLRNMIKVENDSPNERLKLIIKYGTN